MESSLYQPTTLEYRAYPGVLGIPSIIKENWLFSQQQSNVHSSSVRVGLPTHLLIWCWTFVWCMQCRSSACCHVTMSSRVSAQLCLENSFLVVNHLFWLFTFFPISLPPRKGKGMIQLSHLGKYYLGLIIPKFLMFCPLINCNVLVARILLK